MSRDSIHQRIDELLGLLSNHNNRLSLHSEKLSQLDIDALRKQCINVYDEVNRLALHGRIKSKTPTVPDPQEVSAVKHTPDTSSFSEPVKPAISEPLVNTIREEAKQDQREEAKKPLIRQKAKADEEMLSLFEKFSSKPIESITKGMSVAKRFEFQSALFDGDHKEYNHFIGQLESAGDLESAFEIYQTYKTKLEWDSEDLKDELKALMYRKYR